MGGVIEAWTPGDVAGFGNAIVRLRHGLAERPLFSDDGLADVLERYPRQALGVFTMGHDIEDWRDWRRGSAHGLDGRALLDAVRAGRLWLNLRHANDHLPEFAALCDEIAAEKQRRLGTPILNRDLGLLISSPNARVFYHLDVPLASLWQVRGEKRIWFYPRREPFVDPAWLERCVLGVAEGQMPFEAAWDAAAESFAMTPGDMVTWPQNAPHRVDNGPMLSVAVSMEFMTPPARIRASVLHANGLLRRRLGWNPRVQDRAGPAMAAKLALAGAHKAWTARRRGAPALPETFAVQAPPA
ncbi:MAG TPA: hypothetical protein VMU93_08220 [Caulobacteraceae bacterium]|nr:hypothetical protein [Caulobacteraceae bacterium]